ncbi:MAG: S8 family serine peptidase [Deltaproteobacteria bacterium]|nr:S8 family serine peptidase [Deltaproteobacteria bacterium]
MTPNDPLFSEHQSNFRQVQYPSAWEYSLGEGVVVAVIDSGYREGMDDSAQVLDGYDFAENDADPTDVEGHGTVVSNVIGEATNNNVGCAGAASGARIMPLKVFPDGGGGAYDGDIARAIDHARTEGAQVINMSLGGGGFSGITNAAVDDAYAAGLILFAASGNSGKEETEYPAGYANVVSVGSSRPHGVGDFPTRSEFSTYGAALDVIAPGEGVVQQGWSPSNEEGYYSSSGTSVACPHASALGALLWVWRRPGRRRKTCARRF